MAYSRYIPFGVPKKFRPPHLSVRSPACAVQYYAQDGFFLAKKPVFGQYGPEVCGMVLKHVKGNPPFV